ncbi:undecaprenyl/decaprenyl-phosphate alpha-N-acetylglucosaminyl 1-phosphate transferase [Candidatus Gracilibacteria bacterium]|nr:undecaprenyl/decaprenyl-phosphate alpha-N-acetylglucosaminyl 1-phosphate transferase [Candidatus Gracilibacteria bacterium]
MITSFFLIKAGSFVFEKYGILDNPAKYKKTRAPIPYSMGVVFYIAFLILSAAFVEFSDKLLLIWVFGGVITLVSFFDDLFNVSPKLRLLFQIIIGAIIGVTSIKIGYVSNIFGGILNLETYFIELMSMKIYLIPLLFTVVWYVFVFNAFNWADGIEGNTSGLGIISFFILFLLGLMLFARDDYSGGIQNAIFIIQLSIILVAIIIPFWYYDIREKILMGDSGTMFLGFMLATLAIISGGKIATVLVVFGIYSVDAVYVIINRLYNKRNPLKGDFSHLHHRLLDIGLTKRQVLYTVYSLSLLFGVTALFLDKVGKIIVFGIIVVIVVFMNKIIELGKKIK